MNSFESVISSILQSDGYWTQTNYKVDLSPEQKAEIGRPTTPRWDLDVIAYQPGSNTLLVVECKSFLDSGGVSFRGFDPETGGTSRYKLFNDQVLRRVITEQFVCQLERKNLIFKNPTLQLCLAAGNIQDSSKEPIQSHFDKMGWRLLDIKWILKRLDGIATAGYDDSTVSIVAKLLARRSAG